MIDKQKIERLKQMLVSNHENDINLAGALVNNISSGNLKIELIRFIRSRYQHQTEDILNSNFKFQYADTNLGIMIKDINRCGVIKFTNNND